MRHNIYTSFLFLIIIIIASCKRELNPNSLIGKGFKINDSYHMVKFENIVDYQIFQITGAGKSCVGRGRWTLNEGIIRLERNNSNCESTRKIRGRYIVSNNWLERPKPKSNWLEN